MRLINLKLENWGPHESLNVDLDGNIVGIFGTNGRGKSNLLQAIAYALTGDLDKTKGTSYIRNFGNKDGADKAKVVLQFEKGGERGTITREILANGTSKRALEWGERTYKASNEVAAILEEILKADKSAITNAVYIRQGEIARLVRGTPAERQDLFLKLMNLHYTETVTEDVRKAVYALKAGMQDWSTHIKTYEAQIATLSDDIDKLTTRSRELAGCQECRDWLQSYKLLMTRRETASRAVDSLTAKITALNSTLIFQRKRHGNEEDIENAIKDLDTEIREAEACNQAYKEYQQLLTNKTILEVNNQKYTMELQSVDSELVGLGDPVALERAYTDVCNREALANIRNVKLKELSNLQAKLLTSQTELLALDDESAIQENIAKLEDEINTLTREVLIGEFATSDTCPVCGGEIESSARENAVAHLNENKQDYAAAMAQVAGLRTKLTDVSSARARNISTVDDCMARITALTEEIKKLPGVEDTVNADDIREKVARLHQLQTRKTGLEAAMEGISIQLDTINQGMSRITVTEAVQDDVDALKQKRSDTAKILVDIQTFANTLAQVQETAREAYTNYSNIGQEIVDLIAKAPDESLTDIIDAEIDNYLQMYILKSDELLNIRAELNALRSQFKSVKQLLSTAQQHVRNNEVKQRKIAELEDVIRIVNKNGVPLAFANERFKEMTAYVQEMLEHMQANFSVFIDPERPLTYKFIRTDNESDYEMRQERLSGGQSIRLAIALLIACQQLILPEVGLLILDEPSSHIDADGVECMRDMFINMEQLLINSDMQMLIVDHSTILGAAFEKTIEL